MRKKYSFRIHFSVFLFLIVVVLYVWTADTEKKSHFIPKYEKLDIGNILQKGWFTESEYAVLYYQTGLGRRGVDQLLADERQDELLYLQQRFFEPIEYTCNRNYFVCYSERIENHEGTVPCFRDFMPVVKDGDILISFSGHCLGWRSGHAAIVTDAGKGETLEAMDIGCLSQICSMNEWSRYPTFAVLRLKDASDEERAGIAAYAAAKLVNIPYQLVSPCRRDGEAPECPRGTQCAHLVWLAYQHFGYDTDSDGGYFVTPYDIYRSELLEVIQIYGIAPV